MLPVGQPFVIREEFRTVCKRLLNGLFEVRSRHICLGHCIRQFWSLTYANADSEHEFVHRCACRFALEVEAVLGLCDLDLGAVHVYSATQPRFLELARAPRSFLNKRQGSLLYLHFLLRLHGAIVCSNHRKHR